MILGSKALNIKAIGILNTQIRFRPLEPLCMIQIALVGLTDLKNNMLEINEQQKEDLKKCPELKAMVDEYISTNGADVRNEDGEIKFPRFIVRMRTCLEDNIGWNGMCEFLGWSRDSELWEDFTSWGHNSRWKNIFWPWVNENFERAVSVALAIQASDCLRRINRPETLK